MLIQNTKMSFSEWDMNSMAWKLPHLLVYKSIFYDQKIIPISQYPPTYTQAIHKDLTKQSRKLAKILKWIETGYVTLQERSDELVMNYLTSFIEIKNLI